MHGQIEWADKPDSFVVNVVCIDGQLKVYSRHGVSLSVDPVIVTPVKNKYTKTLRALRFVGTNGARYHGRYDARHADTQCTIKRKTKG
jgi:hypothetical protein